MGSNREKTIILSQYWNKKQIDSVLKIISPSNMPPKLESQQKKDKNVH